jgi:hypothetical protein
MSVRPSTPEIITVNSETLQTQIRDLLPSQNGFGSELQASNVITPIIDLTAAAEGSGLPDYLQTALAFGSQTEVSVANSTQSIAATAGFYRIVGAASFTPDSTAAKITLILNDGSTNKEVWGAQTRAVSTQGTTVIDLDLVFWLRAGDEAFMSSADVESIFLGSVRQLALGDGTLVPPNGYPL